MSEIGLLIYGVVGFLVAILSAIASGGGGFVMTPLMIFLGLTPGEAIATGKLGGLSTTTGSLVGMRSRKLRNRSAVVTILILAAIAGFLASRIIINLDGDAYRVVIGFILIAVAPIIYKKKVGHAAKHITGWRKRVGYLGVFIALLAQGTFSSGLGIFVSLALIVGTGLDALDANITKRTSQLLLNSVIVLGVIGSGLILWNVALVGIVANFCGSFIGGKIAVKKGSAFVSKVMAGLALASGIGLLVL